MSSETRIPVKFSHPSELIAAIPHMLSFTPNEAFIFIWKNADDTIIVAQRIDLPENSDPESLSQWEHAAFSHEACRQATSVIAILVTQKTSETENLLSGCLTSLDEDFLTDVFITDFTQWYVPGSSTVYPITAEHTIAAAVALGKTPANRPAGTREDIEAEFQPALNYSSQAWLAAKKERSNAEQSGELPQWHARVLATAGAKFLTRVATTKAEKARLLVGLNDYQVRDALIYALASDIQVTVEDGVNLLHYASRKHVAPTATLIGFIAYLRGDGLRANIAVEMALKHDSEYQLAAMLGNAIDRGIPPQTFAKFILEND